MRPLALARKAATPDSRFLEKRLRKTPGRGDLEREFGAHAKGQDTKFPDSRKPPQQNPRSSLAKQGFWCTAGRKGPPKDPQRGPNHPTHEETPRTARIPGGFRKSKQYDYLDTEVPTERRSWQASMTRSAMPCSAFFM